jgi:coenzyme F420-reducing hydrogenase gamma subunit
VHYPEAYPDVLPEFKLTTVEGAVTDNEIDALVRDLSTIVSIVMVSAACAPVDTPRAKKISAWR